MKTKRVLSAILACVLILFTCPLQASAISNTVVSSIEKTNSTWYGYPDKADIYVASSIAYMGAEWSSARQAWAFNFRFAGTGSADWRNSGSNANVIRCAGMNVDIVENEGNAAFWTSTSSKYIGSAPESGTHPDYGGVANAVVGLAITAINNVGASYAWSTLGLISAFVGITDDSSTATASLYRGWDWTSDKSDVGQFFWFIVDVEPNSTAKISTDYWLVGPGYELLDAGTSYYNLQASSKGNSATTMNPENMSEEEREDCGIETIPREEFNSKAAELNISERSREEFLKSDDAVFYYAHNFQVEESGRSSNLEPKVNASNPSKESLIANIEYHVDRSKKIVRGLSGKNIAAEPENIELCEKHNERIEKLENLLLQMRVDNNVRTQNLYDLYDEYNVIMGNVPN